MLNRFGYCNDKNVLEKVSTDCFNEHFKEFSNVQADDGDFKEFDRNTVTNLNNSVNAVITEWEVSNASNSLKNNRSCGIDLILIEFLKHSSHKMLYINVKLFNIFRDAVISFFPSTKKSWNI